jgi:hypothetical protein
MKSRYNDDGRRSLQGQQQAHDLSPREVDLAGDEIL